MRAAYDDGVMQRTTLPPISPFSLMYPKSCVIVGPTFGRRRLLCPSQPGSLSNDSAASPAFGSSAAASTSRAATQSVTPAHFAMPFMSRLAVDGVDQLPQPAHVAAVEVEAQ